MSISFSNDWSQFKRRIFIRSSAASVYDAWAKQGALEQWFLKKAQFYRETDTALQNGEDIKSGDRFEWAWYGWEEATQSGEVLSMEAGKSITFTFTPAGIVKVSVVIAKDNLTELILHQSGIPTDEAGKLNFFYGCSLGWSFWMVNLKAWLEHGILLDERDMNYDDQRKLEIVNH